jgi:phage terminase Nu1 subunit (DNA packaging protein)
MAIVCESEPKTIVGLADHFRVSRQTIYNWQKAGCPVDGGIAAIEAWLADNRPSEESSGSLREQKLRSQIEKLREEVEEKRIKNARERGELVSRDEIVQEFAEFLSQAAPLLEAFVDEVSKAAPQELRVTVHEIAQHHVYLFKRKLSAWRPGSE